MCRSATWRYLGGQESRVEWDELDSSINRRIALVQRRDLIAVNNIRGTQSRIRVGRVNAAGIDLVPARNIF